MPDEKIVYATTEQKLEIACRLNERFDELCRACGVVDDPEIMALALYARTDSNYRQMLFPGGLR